MATLITKNSSTAAAVPGTGDLVQGELAVNVTDKKLYTKDSGGNIVKVVGSLGNQEANAVAITGGSISGVAGLVASSYQEFTSSGTWTKPAGANFVYVEAIGGGGSGGNNFSTGGSGGGGGLYVSRVFRASDLTATVAVTVGAGGVAVGGNSNGNNGSASTFASYLSAPGGEGGFQNGANRGGRAGLVYGLANSSTGHQSFVDGGTGGGSTNVGGSAIYGGAGGGGYDPTPNTSAGGTSQFAGNGGSGGGATGVAGSAPGGGGGGAAGTSGAGGNGRVRVWTW